MQALLSHPFLAGGGAALIVLGLLVWRWSSRHDLKGLAVDAAWHLAQKRKLASAGDTEIAQRLQDLRDEPTNAGKARKAAGLAARHFIAQIASIAALICMAAGTAMIALALYLG
jgi:hypothetical protein